MCRPLCAALGLAFGCVATSSYAQTEEVEVSAEPEMMRTEITDPGLHTAGVVAVIVGATAMPTGAVFSVLRLLADREVRDECRSDQDRGCTDPDDVQALEDRSDAYGVASASLMLGGLAVLAGGVGLMIASTDEVPVAGDVALSPTLGPHGAGIGIAIRW